MVRRREVLKAAGLLPLSVSMARGAVAWRGRPVEELRIGVVGIRSRGKQLLGDFRAVAGVRVTALCDVDAEVLAGGRRDAEKREERVETFRDVRELLDSPDVDAVVVATPNHWHALISIWACRKGKDVYVEKPVSHDVHEGRLIVAAARRYERIVQAGTQSRSSHAIAEAIAWLREGHLGPVLRAQGLCYKPRRPIGRVSGPQAVPEAIDYELWCGPAPKKELRRRNLHYDWHWDSDYGNGDLGNQGIHQMDVCRWILGESRLAPRSWSLGGRLGEPDDGDTPNTQIVWHDYERAPILFEVRGLPRSAARARTDWAMDSVSGVRIGVIARCEKGTLVVPDYHSAIARDHRGREIRRWRGSRSHAANFVEAVRARDRALLNADIEEGHVSSALCHVANVSWRLGERVSAEEARERIEGPPAYLEAFERTCGHLGLNGIDLGARNLRLGRRLAVDPAEECVLDDPLADAFFARAGRAPFRIPREP